MSVRSSLDGIPASTPVLVGVGQFSERVGETGYGALSSVELAAAAARTSIADAGASSFMADLDVVAGVRQFEISLPGAQAPLGRSDNFCRSVTDRIGASPQRAILDVSGGQAPQRLVNELAAKMSAGEIASALIIGAEAISTARHYAGQADAPDFSETRGGQLEDRGYGLDGLISPEGEAHGLMGAPSQYAVCEHARRSRLGMSRSTYDSAMAAMFAEFTEVAAKNPHAAAQTVRTAEELITVTDRNRLIADPYPRFLVARDQVNQGAALLMCSVGFARRHGVDPERLVFIHGHADRVERPLLERPDLGQSPAAVAAVEVALQMARRGIDDVSYFDLYSCFPIAVFNVCDGVGLNPTGRRALTVTGGLPFFGGPGNNYSMHAIAEMVHVLRSAPGSSGLVGANGGILSKYSAALYSTEPAPWTPRNDSQPQLDCATRVRATAHHDGPASIESFTTVPQPDGQPRHVVIARTDEGARFYANVATDDRETVDLIVDGEPIGCRVHATMSDGLNWVSAGPRRAAPGRVPG